MTGLVGWRAGQIYWQGGWRGIFQIKHKDKRCTWDIKGLGNMEEIKY